MGWLLASTRFLASTTSGFMAALGALFCNPHLLLMKVPKLRMSKLSCMRFSCLPTFTFISCVNLTSKRLYQGLNAPNACAYSPLCLLRYGSWLLKFQKASFWSSTVNGVLLEGYSVRFVSSFDLGM